MPSIPNIGTREYDNVHFLSLADEYLFCSQDKYE